MVAKLPGSSFLRINDIQFDVPPEQITILKRDFNDHVPTLRSQGSTVIKSGKRMISYVIDMYFATGFNALTGDEKLLTTWVNQQLSPLLIQIRKCPFVSIENEKLRKEIFGEGVVADGRNMAAIIKNVTMGVAVRSSEQLKVSITCQSFNHHPYTPDFTFKGIMPNGAVVAQDTPGQPFRTFYTSGTMNNGQFVNAVDSLKGSGMRFIYKQYYELDFDVQNLQEIVEAASSQQEFELAKSTSVFDAGNKSIDQKVEALKKLGWYEEDAKRRTKKNVKLMYRYKMFDIPESVALESGALIIESGSAYMETKTPNIPLQAHAIPTSQFLGCTDATVSFQIFANAELKDEKPVGTSNKLAQLNKIIEIVSQNALKYHRQTLNDSIFIRHPLAKLCKYKQYTNIFGGAYKVFNPVTNKLETFDPNEYLAVCVDNTSSSTVPGHPYCSRFIINMTENYRNEESDSRFKKDGGANKVYESTKGLLRILAKRYEIVRSDEGNGPFVTTTRPIPESPQEKAIADKLVASLNTTVSLTNLAFPGELPKFFDGSTIKTVDQLLGSKELIERTSSDYRDSMFASGMDPEQTAPPMSENRLNEIANDVISIVAKAETAVFSDYNEPMEAFTQYNLVPNDSAYPDMMLPLTESNPDFAWYNLSDELNTAKYKEDMANAVYKDRIEIGEAHANTYLNPKLPEHLQAYEFQPAKWLPTPATNLLATGEKTGGTIETDIPYAQAPLDPAQQAINIRKSIETFNENTYTMRRSMPTFKLYFKEELPEETPGTYNRDTWRNFSDVYDVNSIIDIRMAKEESNPVDVLVIRMTNTRGDLVNRFYEPKKKNLNDELQKMKLTREATSPSDLKGKLKTLEEKQLDGVILKEGTRIELRLGYEDNPNNLSVEFVGRVMSCSGSDIIELVCQGDGVELVQELKGVGISDEYGFKSETSKMIADLLEKSPEVVSFGSTGASTKIGDVNALWQGFGGRSAVENVFAPTLYNLWDKVGEKTLSYTGWGATIGSIVPGLGTIIGAKIGAVAGAATDLYNTGKLFLKGVPYIIYEQTLWEIFQELTLRHPGTIVAVVPYDNRSTLFFGYPEQLYFHRGPTYAEKIQYRANLAERKANGVGSFSLTNKTRRDVLIAKASPFQNAFGTTSVDRGDIEQALQQQNRNSNGVDFASLKPFRSYHVITAEHDIVHNGMVVTSQDVFNAIEVVHPKTSSDANLDGSKGFSSYEKLDPILADDDIYKNYIRKQTLVFHNAHKDPLDDLPERYATSSLAKSLEGAYSGKITILGRPGIKPHDIVFVEDNYNEIYGPVKVGAVTQVFSYSTGWVTEIHPKMIVGVAGAVTVDQVAALKAAAKRYALRNFKIFEAGYFIDEADRTDKSEITKFVQSIPGVVKEGAEQAAYAIGTSASLAVAKRSFTDAGSLASKAAQAAKSKAGASMLSGPAAAGGVYLKAAGKAIKLPLIGFALDYAISSYVSWSKTRQPIAFLPVHRRGVPWYTGLHGLKNNTEIEAAEKFIRDKAEEFNFLYETVIERLKGED